MGKGEVTPGAYNDARIAVEGVEITVKPNPVMFIMLAVLAAGVGALLYYFGGSGQMNINGIVIPQAAAAVIGTAVGALFFVVSLLCVLQIFIPTTLVLNPETRTYRQTAGLFGKMARKEDVSGSFNDFASLRLAHESGQNPNGQHSEWWRLTLSWKNGEHFNLGSFSDQTAAKRMADGFSAKLGMPVENC